MKLYYGLHLLQYWSSLVFILSLTAQCIIWFLLLWIYHFHLTSLLSIWDTVSALLEICLQTGTVTNCVFLSFFFSVLLGCTVVTPPTFLNRGVLHQE